MTRRNHPIAAWLLAALAVGLPLATTAHEGHDNAPAAVSGDGLAGCADTINLIAAGA